MKSRNIKPNTKLYSQCSRESMRKENNRNNMPVFYTAADLVQYQYACIPRKTNEGDKWVYYPNLAFGHRHFLIYF